MRLLGRCGYWARSKTAGAAVVVLALGASPAPASAEGLFSWLFGGGQQRFQPSPSAPARSLRYRAAHKSWTRNPATSPDVEAPQKSAAAKSSSASARSEAIDPAHPLFVVVSLNDEHIRIYDDHGLVTSSVVSTGVPGHPTPKGVFTILGRERFHASNLYSGAPMPYMQRVTWSGVAMHVGVVTGHPASHGCIRLPAAFAVKLWGMTKIGERVVISPYDVAPEGFSSPLLPVAKMYQRPEPAPAPAVSVQASASGTDEAKASAAAPTTSASAAAPTTSASGAAPTTSASAAAPTTSASAANEGAAASDGAKAITTSEAGKPAAPVSAPVVQASAEASRPLNPKEWAVRMKAQAVADQAAAVKAAKQASAALAAQGGESQRLANAVRAAEWGLTAAQSKSDEAARVLEAAAAAVVAKQRESAVAMDEPTKSEADPLSNAKTAMLAKAMETAVAAKAAAAQAKAKADADLETATSTLEQARAAVETHAALHDETSERLRAATESRSAAARAEKEAIQRLAPISVLISKRDHKIYVRQGLAPLFDAPAKIRDPERPLGTHLFIATGVKEAGGELHWTVLTVPDAGGVDPQDQPRRKKNWAQQVEPSVTSHLSPSTPAEALERVEIAQDVRDRIAERLWAGGSIIVSDRPVSNETSAVGTDLTVKVR
ncbi:L,D-transpeptidase family protein [Methylocystis bryophila]|uniref:L,D-TPase catalytic domain-containing protein n=1 Tax=Methylocystis bryophila TaxID=655015 RepID=A0A1W6MYE3_9HYPH|nr:L,D-transpeptidase family protein [Methylocystis bryophila]ARN82617.1 hypothetical protein B1812_17685 [Methylocystis bryophila]BDV38830.1 hypothetical protein DSM21852_20830 [Methylocystis bryophila]